MAQGVIQWLALTVVPCVRDLCDWHSREKEAAAMEELSPYDKKAVDACKQNMANFKANFEDLQKFVKEVIIANFNEFELSVGNTPRAARFSCLFFFFFFLFRAPVDETFYKVG
jgi:hypothetical protein